MLRLRITALIFSVVLTSAVFAAPPNRITRPINTRQTRVLAGSVHRLARAEFDRGAVDPATPIDYITLIVKSSALQRAELEQLIADQQNPSSPLFRKWLKPEEFAGRFGLSPNDHSKVVAWLASEGFQVKESARGRNWIAFTGTAAHVAASLHTPIHRYMVAGQIHTANAADPAVPEALADVIEGFLGLDDFKPESDAKLVSPDLNSGTQHYMAPEDFATIYNLTPLYQAGIDGTGQSIAVVGQSAVSLTDLRAFRTRYNLPANDPKFVLYSGVDPGFTGSQLEGNLDLEWAGAVAPKATIYYIYGASAFTAFTSAVNLNLAPIITISYGGCETDYSAFFYRSIGQQANAQGITVLSSSGDAGATGCDRQGSLIATRGRTAHFPTVLPEITSVGGTQFVEGSGNYWAATNTVNFGSALSYIPEAAWNETSGTQGLLAGGGGVSRMYPKPAWQSGPGVPNGEFRHYPDISLSAAVHDAYYVNYLGSNGGVAGTSASTPAMAGIVALINQYQVSKGFQTQPGLGNINPQLYRLAQTAPSAFHDIVSGNINVPCAQGSPNCLTGSIGYETGPGYDLATGLGSIDATNLVNQWNTSTKSVSVSLTVSATRVALNDTVNATALVANTSSGAPTGTVEFSIGGIRLGSVRLASRGMQGQAADITFPVYMLGTGTYALAASYSGDAAFSGGGATRNVQVITPSGVSAIVVAAPNTIWPAAPDAQGLAWQGTIVLREAAGVPSIVTGFTIDGVAQPLASYFPSTNIPGGGTVNVDLTFRNLPVPLIRTFGFTGVDPTGQTWSRKVDVKYLPLAQISGFYMTATPLSIIRNPSDPSCEWPVQVHIDELGGFTSQLSGLIAGGVSLSRQIASIFGTTRLDAWGSLQGTVCFNGISPPATNYILVGATNGFAQEVLVSFAAAPATPGKLTATPGNISLASPSVAESASATIAVDVADKTQAWTVSVFPGNRTAGWLTVSPLSGTGTAQITLTASGFGYAPGAYRATVVIQSPNGTPQSVSVPVMFVLGGSASGPAITSVSNAASGSTDKGAAGMLLSIFGKQLAHGTETASGSPMPYSLAGVSAVVNGVAAPVLYASPSQVNIQVPFEAGAGPAVVGLNNSGQIAGFQFEMLPAAPGIFKDAEGKLIPQATLPTGKSGTLFLTGAGDVTPALTTGFATSPASSVANGPKPLLPLSLSIGGVPAFIQAAAIAPGRVGMVQVNFILPSSVAAGPQPVVVTIGGVASPPVNLVVTQ